MAEPLPPRPAPGRGTSQPALLSRVIDNAPNLLPRLARVAPGWLARGLSRPVFMVGCGRSGKTVLAEVLGTHPDIALFPGEANHLWHPRLYPWRYSPHRHSVPPVWFDPAAFGTASSALRTRTDLQMLKATFGAYQRLSGRPVFLNESAMTAVILPVIRAEFPGARIIHVVRDGRAAAAAWAQRQHEQIQQHRTRYAECGLALAVDEVLERCAASWNTQILQTERLRQSSEHATHFYQIRYEDYCADPLGNVAALLDYLDLPFRPERMAAIDHIRNRNRQDLEGVPASALQRITGLMAPGLRLHGYV